MKIKFVLLFNILFLSIQFLAVAQTKPKFQLVQGEGIKAGQAAPDVSFQDINGKTIKLSDYRGKIVLLDVWATWCVPCIKGMPDMNQLYVDNKKDVVMIAVCSADNKPNFDRFVKNNEKKFDFIFAFDAKESKKAASEFRRIYAINGFPTTMVIDKNGTLVDYGFNSEEIAIHIKTARNFPYVPVQPSNKL